MHYKVCNCYNHYAFLYCVQKGLTALHFSALKGHLHVLRALVNEFKVDPDVVDNVSLMQMHVHVYLLCV